MRQGALLALSLLGALAGAAAFVPAARSPTSVSRARHMQLEANLLDRFVRVVRSNARSLLNRMEDPEKVIEQAMADMQNDLVKIRTSYAQVSATLKRMERQRDNAAKLADEWYKRAQLALEQGDEELAREALARKQTQQDTVDSLSAQIEQQSLSVSNLFQSMQALEAKIGEAKSKKDQYIARARTAKTTQQVNDMLGSMTGSTSMDAFERMADKVEAMEASAEVAGELAASTGSRPLEERFKALDTGNKVDDELARMKRALPGGQKETQGLPAGASSSGVDPQLEALRREMGK